MKNQEIAKIFYNMAEFLRMEDVQFKPAAYEKVAVVLESLEQDVEDIYEKGGLKSLENIPGVGKNIAQKIEEYLKTGQIKDYQRLKKRIPVAIDELSAIEGIGPKKIKILYQKLGIKNLNDLAEAAKKGKIASLFGFGPKSEKNILEGIAFLKKSQGRFLLGEILPEVKEILKKLEALTEVKQINAAGSVRRMKETIGDVDILIISKKPEIVMDFFVSLPDVIKIWAKGPTRSSVRMAQGFDCDLRVVPEKSYGSALQYFTGSKEHNVALRRVAIEQGLKLNEYGLFRGKKMISGRNEKDIYKSLSMNWMEPELRENRGEIEASLRQVQDKPNGLPKIISYKDIKGDLHCHSSWDGGANSIKEMAEAALGMGYQYLGISDHTKFLKIENGLDEKQLSQQKKEIDKLNKKLQVTSYKLQVLHGCEANILNNGSIDNKDKALKKLDYAIAGIHSSFKMPKKNMTERLIRAMKNPHIDIISHPTGRVIKKRDEYQIDCNKILKTAKETKTILEINSFPERLDLNDQNIKKAKEVGVKMIINTDAHHKDHLRFMEFGISQARRGWAEKKDIINTQPLDELLKFFEN